MLMRVDARGYDQDYRAMRLQPMNRFDQRSIVGAFLVAAVVSAVLFAAFTFATDESGL